MSEATSPEAVLTQGNHVGIVKMLLHSLLLPSMDKVHEESRLRYKLIPRLLVWLSRLFVRCRDRSLNVESRPDRLTGH